MDVLGAKVSSPAAIPKRSATPYVILTGNPNCGKTTLFNALTGLRAKVGNYAGVTVERKEGRLIGASRENPVVVLDLPGTYSLSPQSLDEQIARDILFHRLAEVPPPDVVVVVVDASNLQRNLYFATQVIELGYRTIVALNMIDVARQNGHHIDTKKLSVELGVPVCPVVATTGEGLSVLRQAIQESGVRSQESGVRPGKFGDVPESFQTETQRLADFLEETFPESHFQATAEAQLILTDDRFITSSAEHYPQPVRTAVNEARASLQKAGIDWRSVAIEARYVSIAAIQQRVTTETVQPHENLSDRLDRVFTHRVWGLLIFLGIMMLMFQSIFTFARWPMDMIDAGVGAFGQLVSRMIPAGPLQSLLVDGVIAGVGAVIVFLPQICLLFLFIGLLEDTGYMARAAFLMDRLMSRVGLHGKSFIPMLSSFACAIPGIMATRTIESRKDRLVTILVAPLMSCSARLPVYIVLIGAAIPNKAVLGFLKLSALTMLSMYLLGIIGALGMAWLFKKTLLKGPTPLLIMELPPYKRPLVKIILRHMWDRSKIFIRRAGTVILGISILLWFLASYPKDQKNANSFQAQREALQSSAAASSLGAPASPPANRSAAANLPAGTPALPGSQLSAGIKERLAEIDKAEAGAQLRHSYAGRLGHFIEPAIRPLGFDWQMGIGIVSSFAAREVFVSTMSLVYNVGKVEDPEKGAQTLALTMRDQKRPDGTPVYSTLTVISLMVFYVFALQCVSTVAIVRRETNSWKWPLFQWVYMGALAWVMAFITYQGGRAIGWQ